MVLNWLEELKARVPTKRLAYSSFVVNGSGQVLPGREVYFDRLDRGAKATAASTAAKRR
jgi:hypothetical protein